MCSLAYRLFVLEIINQCKLFFASLFSEQLKEELDVYITEHFPQELAKVLHMPKRVGLAKTMQKGIDIAKGDVIVIFDCHMEVNIDW